MTSPGSEGEPGPATRAAVLRELPQNGVGVPVATIDAIVAAVNARVRAWHPVQYAADGVTPLPDPADIVHGANMLASRIVARRNSPAGVATFGTEALPQYVQRNDPDVAMFLRLGPYAVPRVG